MIPIVDKLPEVRGMGDDGVWDGCVQILKDQVAEKCACVVKGTERQHILSLLYTGKSDDLAYDVVSQVTEHLIKFWSDDGCDTVDVSPQHHMIKR